MVIINKPQLENKMKTKAILEYESLSVPDKLNFSAFHRPGVNIVRQKKQGLDEKRRFVQNRASLALRGIEKRIASRTSSLRFFFWTNASGFDMRDMTREQYELYCSLKRQGGSSCGSINWKKLARKEDWREILTGIFLKHSPV